MPKIDLPFNPPAPGAWELEVTHMARPFSRWFETIFPAAFAEGFRASMKRYGALLEYLEPASVNRFLYFCARGVGAPKGAKAPPPKFLFKLLTKLHPEMRRRIRQCRDTFENKIWREDVRRWDAEWKPAAMAECKRLQQVDPSALSDADLARHLDECRDAVYRSVALHHRLNATAMTPLGDFLVHATEWTKLPPARLLELFKGAAPVSLGAAAELQELVDVLRERPHLLSGSDAKQILDSLLADPVAGAAARRYIDKVGIRVATGYDVSDLTLAEMPELLVEAIRAALEKKNDAPGTSSADAVDAVRERVPPEQRAKFDELLREALDTYRIRDERVYLNDAWATGLARRAILAAGERLAKKGRLLDATHALELTPQELVSVLTTGEGPSAAEAAAHADYRTTHTTSDAPPILGFPPAPPPPPEWLPPYAARSARATAMVLGEMFAINEEPSTGGTVVGIAASPGECVGTARLVINPADMANVRAGEILVTRSTAPSYNALLPLIRGIVTDRGGTLSHAALVAREYGIPAVVGCSDATMRIPDGARIRIDGSTGSVQILA